MTAHWNGAKWKLVKSPSPTGATELNVLSGVSVASGSNAWAVGFSIKHSPHAAVTVALHWNGKAWTHVPSPRPGHGNGDALEGVAALSATNAFAVGSFRNAKNMVRDLAIGWNGRTWNLVPIPTPPATKQSSMSGVTATSDTNAWAVGFYSSGTAEKIIIVHWNGKSWHRQL